MFELRGDFGVGVCTNEEAGVVFVSVPLVDAGDEPTMTFAEVYST